MDRRGKSFEFSVNFIRTVNTGKTAVHTFFSLFLHYLTSNEFQESASRSHSRSRSTEKKKLYPSAIRILITLRIILSTTNSCESIYAARENVRCAIILMSSPNKGDLQ